jgi:lipopolysaccharide export LptBFGC system permease protein LptF
MHKFLNSVVATIITNIILIGVLVFQMSNIYVPITHSFESKAKKDHNGYVIVLTGVSKYITDKSDIMYISKNKNEKVMKVKIALREKNIYFENSDSAFAENYDQTYTYEIVTKQISLLECIFSRGGKTIE